MDYVLSRIREATEKALSSEKTVKKKHQQRLYLLIYTVIKNGIINDDIPFDASLPPTRKLAEFLGVSRSTIIRSYELLRLEGYIESTGGSGHQIKSVTKKDVFKNPVNSDHNYADLSTLGKSFINNITLINSTDDKSVAFRPGLPPLDIFPVNQWKNLSNSYWRYIKSSSLSYSPSSGIEQLKKNIANYLNLVRGIKCDHRQVFIVSGSLQSLYLCGAALLNHGDTVVMENPTFPNVFSTFKGMGATIHAEGIDAEGLDVSKLEGIYPKLIHVTPSCHYPSSIPMSLARKKTLLEYANKTGAFIIENDYEHEISNWQKKSDSLFDLDDQNRVIYMGTFNRLLHPSLRIGYMIVPPNLHPAIESIQKHSHRFVSPSIQVVLNQFIEKKHIYFHNQKVMEVIQERKAVFMDYFNEYLGEMIALEPQQATNLQFLGRIKTKQNDKDVAELFAQHNIVSHRYSKCFVDSPDLTQKLPDQGLILGFASVRIPTIKQKLSQMSNVYLKSGFE